MKVFSLALLLVASTFTLSAQQVTNLNDSGPGSLRQAVINAAEGDILTFDSNLIASGNDTIHLTAEIIVNKGLTIIGPASGANMLYIDADSNHRHLYVDLGPSNLKSLSIERLAFTRGKVVDDNGSSILLLQTDSLFLENCVFEKNYVENLNSGEGGCVFGDLVNVEIVNCSLYNNGSDTNTYKFPGLLFLNARTLIAGSNFEENFGGGPGTAIASALGSEVLIEDCIFTRNSSTEPYGGGVIRVGRSATTIRKCSFLDNDDKAIFVLVASTSPLAPFILEDCLFRNNKAEVDGGTVTIIGTGTTSIRRNTFLNHGGDGNVLFIRSNRGDFQVKNCTFSNIGSVGGPGAIRLLTDSVTFEQCTFDQIHTNSIFFDSFPSIAPNQVTISNSIFTTVNGTTNTARVSVISKGYNIFTDSPNYAVSTDILNADTSLIDLSSLANHGGLTPTLIPSDLSIALNAGAPTNYSAAQNGPIFGTRDIGAAERPVIFYDTANACGTVNWWGNSYSQEGQYMDTAFNANTIDSIGVLILSAQDTGVYDLDGTLYSAETDTNTSYQWVDCANNYAPINGATSLNFLPPSNGQYAVILTNQNCTDTSGCYDYNRFSIVEQHFTPDAWLVFYPNPSDGIVHFETANVKVVELVVFDLSGREVMRESITSETVNLSELQRGVYLAHWIGAEGEIQVSRLVRK